MRKPWCRNTKQSEEDPGVKDVSNEAGGFCFRQGCSTGGQRSTQACETCVCVCVCLCSRIYVKIYKPSVNMFQIHFWIAFPTMFSFVKFVMSFSVYKGKCQPQRHQVTAWFFFLISPDSVSSPAVKNNRLLSRQAPRSEEQIVIELPYRNKWCLRCCWCRWLCLPYPGRYSRRVLQVTEALFFLF